MKLTNDCYRIQISGKAAKEFYYRDADGWLKESARGRKFRATAEQVLNHVLPVLAGAKPNLRAEVEYLGSAIGPRKSSGSEKQEKNLTM